MKIAFFDSGIGGINVLKEAIHLFPNENYIYYADAEHVPYGGRPKQEVAQLIEHATDFLARQNIDLLVLACHTASRLVKDKLQAKYDFPVIGMQTGIKQATLQQRSKKTLIGGTDLSVKIWESHFQSQNLHLDYLSLQELVRFAETKVFYDAKVFSYLYQKLALIDWDEYHTLFLGCTHFPFFKPQILDIIPRKIQVLDGIHKTVQQLGTHITQTGENRDNIIQYFKSGKLQTSTELNLMLNAFHVH